MAKGISPALPLSLNDVDGPYRLNKDLPELIKQNLKMVLFTIPGEMMMNPNFGVGLSKYVFENLSDDLINQILGDIKEGVEKYLPYVGLENVIVLPPEEDLQRLNITIQYLIPGNFGIQQLSFVLGGQN